MENADIKVGPFGIKYGVIASLAAIIFSIILNITGLNTNQALGYVVYLILGGIMYLGCNNYKEANGGYIAYGQGVGLSMIVASISGFISSVFTYMYISYIDDSFIALIKEQQIEEFEKQKLDDEAMDTAMEMLEYFLTPEVISITALIGMLFMGLIVSLIVSAIVKRQRPMFE